MVIKFDVTDFLTKNTMRKQEGKNIVCQTFSFMHVPIAKYHRRLFNAEALVLAKKLYLN